jgi:RNA 3'-terminal phosphate cyclase
MGERAARRALRFLDDEDSAVDPWLADQLAVPMALAGGGGRLHVSEVTSHLETVAGVLRQFGVPVETWGRHGGPGGLAVGAFDPAQARP